MALFPNSTFWEGILKVSFLAARVFEKGYYPYYSDRPQNKGLDFERYFQNVFLFSSEMYLKERG